MDWLGSRGEKGDQGGSALQRRKKSIFDVRRGGVKRVAIIFNPITGKKKKKYTDRSKKKHRQHA